MDRIAYYICRYCPLPLLIATVALSATARAGNATPAGHCLHVKHVLAAGKVLVAFERRNVNEVAVCFRRTGRVRSVTAGSDFYFRPPARAVDVSGPFVGYAEQRINDGVTASHDAPSITIADMRLRNPFSIGPRNSGYSYQFIDVAKIGSLGITSHLQVAWIQCPDPQGTANGLLGPTCRRAGYQDAVYADVGGAMSKGRPMLLDRGRRIDPLSLRVAHGHATWLHGGRRRSAALPTVATVRPSSDQP